MGGSPQSGFQGLIKTILSSMGPPQPAATAAPTGPTSDGGWNDNWGGGNAPAASPDAGGDMSEAIPSLPSGTTPPNAVSAIPPGVLNQPYPVKKRTPLDYLMMAASPVVSGLVQSLLVRRHRGRAFAAGALQTGFGEAASELERPERIKAAQHQRDIENILLQKNVRGTPIQGVDPNTGVGKTIYPGTQEVIPGIGPQPRVLPNVETREVTNPDGSKSFQEYDRQNKVWKASTQESTDAAGNKTRVPMVNAKPPEKPAKETKTTPEQETFDYLTRPIAEGGKGLSADKAWARLNAERRKPDQSQNPDISPKEYRTLKVKLLTERDRAFSAIEKERRKKIDEVNKGGLGTPEDIQKIEADTADAKQTMHQEWADSAAAQGLKPEDVGGVPDYGVQLAAGKTKATTAPSKSADASETPTAKVMDTAGILAYAQKAGISSIEARKRFTAKGYRIVPTTPRVAAH